MFASRVMTITLTRLSLFLFIIIIIIIFFYVSVSGSSPVVARHGRVQSAVTFSTATGGKPFVL